MDIDMRRAALPVCAAAQDATALKTEKERLSYAMGMDLGGQLKAQSVDIDPAPVRGRARSRARRRQDVADGAEAKSAIAQLQMARVAKQTVALQASGAKNKTEGDAFMAVNGTKAGVVALPSGVRV